MARNKKEKQIKHYKHPALHKFLFGLKITLLVLLVLVLVGGIVFYFMYGQSILGMQRDGKELVANSTVETFRQSETSVIYDSRGKTIAELKGEKDVYYLAYEDIPQYVKDAAISVEDKQFASHNGVDLKGIVRALWAYVQNKGEIKQGASTITQQLSRMTFLTNEKSWDRKIKEMFIALEMEKKYSKQQILEFYLNNAYFANGRYGIEAASYGYFSKGADKLSLSETAFLCSIWANPTVYDPLTNYDRTILRRDKILENMHEEGKITLEECNAAKAETIKLKLKETEKKDYVESYAVYCAVRALMANQGFNFKNQFSSVEEKNEYDENYSKTYGECQRSLFTGGYRIYTSIDMKKQKQLQKSVNTALKDFKDKTEEGIYKLQSAAVCIDNKNGRVVAIVGGRNQSVTGGYTLNRAYQSYRQPGSSIKPLIVYAPAFERGYTPDSIVVDQKFEGGPSNADHSYAGNISIRRAVAKSKNTIAWKLFEEMTPATGLSYLLKMNFAKIQKNDYYPAASLGGFTEGTSPVEMASAYAALENQGIYREPTCIKKITDSSGNEIVANEVVQKRVYGKEASIMATDCMTTVMENGTGYALKLANMSCAGKTGTTDDKKDGWFCGYTPYFTTSVWVGYDTPKTLEGLSGGSYPGQIWKDFMTLLHENLENKPFEGLEEQNNYNDDGDDTKPEEEDDDKTDEAEASQEPEESEEPEEDDIDDVPDTTTPPTDTKKPDKDKPVTKPPVTKIPVTQVPVTKAPVVTEPPAAEPTQEPQPGDIEDGPGDDVEE